MTYQLQVGELTAELEPECGTEGVEAWWGPGLQQRWLLGSWKGMGGYK